MDQKQNPTELVMSSTHDEEASLSKSLIEDSLKEKGDSIPSDISKALELAQRTSTGFILRSKKIKRLSQIKRASLEPVPNSQESIPLKCSDFSMYGWGYPIYFAIALYLSAILGLYLVVYFIPCFFMAINTISQDPQAKMTSYILFVTLMLNDGKNHWPGVLYFSATVLFQVVTGLFFWFLYKNWKKFASEENQSHYALVLSKVPEKLSKEKLEEDISSKVKDEGLEITDIIWVPDFSKMDRLRRQIKFLKKVAFRSMKMFKSVEYHLKNGESICLANYETLIQCPKFKQEFDQCFVIQTCMKKVDSKTKKLQALYDESRNMRPTKKSVCFIVFNFPFSRKNMANHLRSLKKESPQLYGSICMKETAHPEDYSWENLYATDLSKNIKKTIYYGVAVIFCAYNFLVQGYFFYLMDYGFLVEKDFVTQTTYSGVFSAASALLCWIYVNLVVYFSKKENHKTATASDMQVLTKVGILLIFNCSIFQFVQAAYIIYYAGVNDTQNSNEYLSSVAEVCLYNVVMSYISGRVSGIMRTSFLIDIFQRWRAKKSSWMYTQNEANRIFRRMQMRFTINYIYMFKAFIMTMFLSELSIIGCLGIFLMFACYFIDRSLFEESHRPGYLGIKMGQRFLILAYFALPAITASKVLVLFFIKTDVPWIKNTGFLLQMASCVIFAIFCPFWVFIVKKVAFPGLNAPFETEEDTKSLSQSLKESMRSEFGNPVPICGLSKEFTRFSSNNQTCYREKVEKIYKKMRKQIKLKKLRKKEA